MLRRNKLSLVSLGLLLPLGCNNDDVNAEDGGSCDLLAGDLVITEIVADVDGDDKGLEWFEIYNASSTTIDLEGRTLVYSKADGTGRHSHTIARDLEIPPGGYVTVGSVLDEVAQGMPHLDYGYGEDLGEFGNAGGYLAIECEDDVVDEAYYVEAIATASRALDGSAVPDATANDFVDNWCDSRTEQVPGFAATPKAPNDVCGSQTGCTIGEQSVMVVHPAPGELVITEVMPNPELAADDVGEWFEIHSLATADFHLNGVEIGRSLEETEPEETIAAPECIVITPGSYAVIANNADAMMNGGVPAESIVWETGVALTNTDGALWLGLDSGPLDSVTWGSAGTGEATQLDPDFSDPADNDDLGNWCDAETPYGLGDLGTPGAENVQCTIIPPEGQCNDGGELRDIVPVAMGDLVITELLPNPDAVPEADGEWFEVLALGGGDLNGLELGKDGAVEDTVTAEDCMPVTAGQYLVFARESDSVINGGLSQVDGLFAFALLNTSGNLFIGYGGQVHDAVTWTSSGAGLSRSLGAGNFTTTANDDEGLWCDGVGVYGAGDQGTPGEANPDCDGGPIEGSCIDPDTNMMRMADPPAAGEVIISEIMPNPSLGEPGAEWFEIYASAAFDLNGLELGKGGAVSHTVTSPTCMEVAADSYLVLARSDVDAENCMLPQVDYLYGTLGLSNSNSDLQIGHGGMVFDQHAWTTTVNGVALSYDMMGMSWCEAVDPFGCGDLGTPGAANPACGGGSMDGMCFDGMVWRDIVVPSPGQLVISELMANPSIVTDANGEWFEIRALAPFDLNGLELGKFFTDGPLETVDVADCIALAAGDTALLATNADTMTNGGLPAVDYEFALSLTNTNSALHVAAAGVLLDEITWTAVGDGLSTSLDPDNYNPDVNDLAANDGVIWCWSMTPTPGADNAQCN
jgi:hypothetical protein